MTDPRRTSTRRAVLSYSQLKEFTGWQADLMVEDYQGILQDFVFTADEIDGIDIRVTINEADIIDLDVRVTENEEDITDLDDRVTVNESNISDNAQAISERLKSALSFVEGDTYQVNDYVTENGWAAYALVETSDPIQPLPKGSPFNVYSGVISTNPALTNQLIYGQRYKFDEAGFINGYRIYTITGNEYAIYLVNEPNNENAVSTLLTLTATTTGWNNINLVPRLIDNGSEFDLVVVVSEPDPTPTTTTLSYNYTTPTNNGVPAVGFALHADKSTSQLRVNKTDQNGDQSAFLSTVSSGDTIEGGGIKWAIQGTPIDGGSYWSFTVAPTQQGSPDGIQDFVFTTVTATPITYAEDLNYWLSSTTVRGLFTSTGGIGDLVVNDNQYGIDLLIQYVDISPDWFRTSFSAEFSTATSDSLAGSINTSSGNLSLSNLTPINTTARYGIDPPVYAIDETINITGDYEVSIGFEAWTSATNRSAMVGIYIDGVLQDNIYNRESKDTSDIIWAYKVFDYTFTGFTDLKIQVGKGNGGGGSTITIDNVRFKAKKI